MESSRDRGVDAVEAVLAGVGPYRARLERTVRRLARETVPFDALVRDSGFSRRTVDSVLAAFGDDIVANSDGYRLRDGAAADCLRRFPATGRGDDSHAAAAVADIVAHGPAAKTRLDHVAATAETALRRARWLDDTYGLDRIRLLCLGDHDLTALAAAAVNPRATVAVADVDEDLLSYVDTVAGSRGFGVRGYYGDLRFALPADLMGWADVVFTDPPYTPEGIALFASHGIRALRDRDHGTVVVSYGFSERSPTLGWKVQRELSGLGLVFEAILPGFNAYHGAQAIGGRSDLYVCRPTSRSARALEQRPRGAAATIYTRGPQSSEAEQAGPGWEPLVSATCDGGREPAGVVGEGHYPESVPHARLGTLFDAGLPRDWTGRDGVVLLDLAADPGPWLLRALLAANAPRLALAVPNNHPDLAFERAQRGLAELVGGKYRLRFRRGVPESAYALVEAERRDPAAGDRAARLRAFVLARAHGSLAAAWREGLIRAGAAGGEPLTKKRARAVIAADVAAFPSRVIDTPRHRLPALLAALDAAAAGCQERDPEAP